jgi:hypothetical protein
MKSIKILLFFSFLCSIIAFAQEKEAQFKQFNNFSADFEVPEGKTWIIQSIFSSSIGELTKNADGTTSSLPVRIFIKTINGDIKTDYQGGRFGPQVYQSDNNLATISYPLSLPENTKFSLIIVVGNPGEMKAFNGIGFMTLYEVTNNTF